MSNTIKIKRGAESSIPILAAGEPAFTLDTHKLYIGDGVVNRLISCLCENGNGNGNGSEGGSAGMSNLVFYDGIDGNAINTHNWEQSYVSMTQAQSGGFLNLNNSSLTTANKYSIINSIQRVLITPKSRHRIIWAAKTPNTPQANAIMEIGAGFVSGTSAPTSSGAYFRWGATFKAIANWNGTEIASADITPPSINEAHYYEIVIEHNKATYYIDDAEVAAIAAPAAGPISMKPLHIPLFARVYNGGSSPSSAPQLSVCFALAKQEGAGENKPWQHQKAGMGRGSYQSQVHPFDQTANHANSASPLKVNLSNSVPGYLTLGGRYRFDAESASSVDYCLFAYKVPVGFQLYIDEVIITAANTEEKSHGNKGMVFDWSVGINSSGASLATPESPPSSWAPRKIPVGVMSLMPDAKEGTMFSGSPLRATFSTPLVVDSDRYFHIILQIPSGSHKHNQVIRGDVFVNGTFH